MKIYAHVQKLEPEEHLALSERVTDGACKGRLEHIFRLTLASFDWNCQQHITPRFTEAEVVAAIDPLRKRLAELETENAELRATAE